ncbi:MAG: hypothetical protein WAN49_09745, partial [Pseudolabrys sp.]
EVCKAVSLCHYGLAVFDNSDSHSGNFLPRHLPRDKSIYLHFEDRIVGSVALAQADALYPLALLRVHCKRASDRGGCHAAEHNDELAAAFQMIELHSVPHQPGPLQDIELALVSQALLRFAWLQLKRAFNGPESYVCLLTQSVQNSNIITFESQETFRPYSTIAEPKG